MIPRIGFGYDVHVLSEGYDFWLGGIKLRHYKGCIAHSDGDALIHALCDALLGAAALGDIGTHFPDTDEQYKGIDSKILLAKVVELLENENYTIGNVDITIALQKPRVKDCIPEMQKTLAKTAKTSEKNISIKATTTEKLGFVGSENGIAVYAVALIYKV